MKFSAPLVILATQLAAVYAGSQVAARNAVEEECGALGVLDYSVSDLPAGVDEAIIRKCKEHPMSLQGVTAGPDVDFVHESEVAESANTSPVARSESLDSLLAPRACLKDSDANFGCSKNSWCWVRCGAKNNWCWLAWDQGYGEWRGCRSNEDCRSIGTSACGQGAGCSSCGCGC